MATKRRKKSWWQMLRGPRGHRGLPGYDQETPKRVTVLQQDVQWLKDRVSELERKLTMLGSASAAIIERLPTPEAAIHKMEGSQK